MRITVSHNQTREEVTRSVDRSFDDLFRGLGGTPIQFVSQRREWHGSVLTFSMSAKMGLLSAPVRGSIEVTDRDLIFDIDLGLLERIIASTSAREVLTSRVRGLLR